MMSDYIQGIDYDYVVPEEGEDEGTTTKIRLLNGVYAGTIYHYGKVSFEGDPLQNIHMKFVYNVIESPFDKDALQNDNEFKNQIGDILIGIMDELMSRRDLDETGTDYIEESGLE